MRGHVDWLVIAATHFQQQAKTSQNVERLFDAFTGRCVDATDWMQYFRTAASGSLERSS